MRVASIDIGTNSIRLLVAELKKEGDNTILIPIFRTTKITRLGNQVDNQRIISQSAIERAMDILTEYLTIAKKYNAKEIYSVGTSVLRDAANRDEFIISARDRLGLEVKVISGDEEAYLSFLGVISAFPSVERCVVTDIGGGSTEFIFAEKKNILIKESLDIGSVRLTERYFKHDPPLPQEMELVRKETIDYLQKLPIPFELDERECKIIGVAGTVTSLAAIAQRLEVYDPEKVHGYKLTKTTIEGILNELVSKPLAERKKIAGLDPARADIIIAGTIITHQILSYFQLNYITVSERDLLDGLILTNLPKFNCLHN